MQVEFVEQTVRMFEEGGQELRLRHSYGEAFQLEHLAGHGGLECVDERFEALVFEMVMAQIDIFQADRLSDALCDLNHGVFADATLDQSQVLK